MGSWKSDLVIDMAIKGMIAKYLPPSKWEDLRIRLQDIYQQATGEPMAVLTVENAPSDLQSLIQSAIAKIDSMTPDERAAMHEAQRQSYARSIRPCPHGKIDFEDCPHCRMEAKK